MRWMLVVTLLAFAAISARAEPQKLSYQAVMHVVESHASPVLDRQQHVIGIGEFRGLAIFAEAGVARHRYEGWFDFVDGSGPFHGYAVWVFEDGSEIRARYDGRGEVRGKDNVTVQAEFREGSGTGRFADARITGRFEGKRFDPISDGGATHLRGELIIEPK